MSQQIYFVAYCCVVESIWNFFFDDLYWLETTKHLRIFVDILVV
jgi:hypothetical protein